MDDEKDFIHKHSLGEGLDMWASAIHPHILGLTEPEQLRLLSRHKVSSFDELALTLSKRYPTIDPKSTPDVFKQYFKNNAFETDPSFTKTPTHDKDPYDKDPYHERAGFSRSTALRENLERLTYPSKEG